MDEATEVRGLLTGWALDAVDDAERARIERAIQANPSLAVEARAMVETAARLAASSAKPPPPDLRAQVLTAVDSVPQRKPEQLAGPSQVVGRRPRTFTWIALAAVATIGVIAPSVLAVQQAGRAERAEQQVAVFTEALAQPGATILAADVVGGGQAVAVLSDAGVLFAARGLAALDEEYVYQLWVIGEGDPVSAGILEVGGGAVQVSVNAVQTSTLAVSIEPAGGSSQPTTTPIVFLPEPPPADPEAAEEAPAGA